MEDVAMNSTADLIAPDLISYNSTFNMTIEAEYVPYEKRPETYIVPAVFAVIFLLGKRLLQIRLQRQQS